MIKCPHCGSSEGKIYKHGKSQNSQRYKCQTCGKTFKNKNYAIKLKKEKEFAIALLNLLKADPNDFDTKSYTNLDLSSLFNFKEIDENSFKDVSVQIKAESLNSKKKIKCNNPRIIISLVGEEIRLTLLPQYDFRKVCPEMSIKEQGSSGRWQKTFDLAHEDDPPEVRISHL